MSTRFFSKTLSGVGAAAMLACLAGAAPAQAADRGSDIMLQAGHTIPNPPAVQLQQWTGTFTDHLGNKVVFTMVGPEPKGTSATTYIPVIVIPIKLVFGKKNGNKTFDPLVDVGLNSNTVIADVFASPLFNFMDFNQGGTDLGNTQYIDAFQRGNFWQWVNQNGGGYHVILNPSLLQKELTITVTPSQGSVKPSGDEAVMKHSVLDAALRKFMKNDPVAKAYINPGTLAVFITDDVSLISNFGTCCDSGYHTAMGVKPSGQTYVFASYSTLSGSKDVGALSHELGEWMDDPFARNIVYCPGKSLLEVGDPIHNGDYPYALNGRTYHLQSLVFLGYFGAPDLSVNHWLSFQNDMPNVCSGQ